jgi:hypothetical protein
MHLSFLKSDLTPPCELRYLLLYSSPLTHFLFSSFFSRSPILSLLQFLLLYSLFLSLLAGVRWLALGGPARRRAGTTHRASGVAA